MEYVQHEIQDFILDFELVQKQISPAMEFQVTINLWTLLAIGKLQ